jgi:hypothetical protein
MLLNNLKIIFADFIDQLCDDIHFNLPILISAGFFPAGKIVGM